MVDTVFVYCIGTLVCGLVILVAGCGFSWLGVDCFFDIIALCLCWFAV